MTGEMSKSDLVDYPTHQAVADALGCELRPFDVYQGPYIVTDYGKIWLQQNEHGYPFVVLTQDYSGKRPRTRLCADYSERAAISAARAVIRDARRAVRP